MKHTFTLASATGDTRILARSAMGFDWNYFVAGEYQIFKHGDNELISSTKDVPAGAGFDNGTSLHKTSVVRNGDVILTTILIDLTDLNSGGTILDIIGKADTGYSHIGQVTTAVNGVILGGRMSCLETPATGEPDIDLYSATEATGAEEALVTGLTQTEISATGADWTPAVAPKLFGTIVADQYLYLVTGIGSSDNATYTAGRIMLELWGYPT